MSIFKIKDLATEISDRVNDPKQSGYDRFVGLEHYDSGNVRIIRYGDASKMQSSAKAIQKGDVLIARRNVYLKRAGIVDFDGLTSGDSIVLRAKNEVIRSILPFIFNTDKFWKYANKFSDGSMSKRLSPKILMEYEVDLPDNDEDIKRLACLLWSISDTLDSYKEMIKQCDELVKGQFVEMFGKCKRTVLVKDCCTYHSRIGWQALTTKEHQSTGEYLLITGTDFIDNRINYDTCVYVSKERYDMDIKLQIKNGDILITKDGTIGKVAVVDDLPMSATLNAGIFVVRPDKRFFKEFIEYVFKGDLFQQFIEKSKTGATIKHLNQNKLENFEIILPEISKQQEFAEFYNHLDKSKFAIKEAMKNAQKIFDGILKESLK